MNDKERWDATLDLFLSLEERSKFNEKSGSGDEFTWTVRGVDYEDGRRILLATTGSRTSSSRWTLEDFIRLNCVAIPEPEKSEAEKLFESIGDDKPFWALTEDGSSYQSYNISQIRSSPEGARRSVLARCNGCGFNEKYFNKEDFIARNATATRPKTEREEELEEELEGWEELIGLKNTAIEQAESRVKELENQLAVDKQWYRENTSARLHDERNAALKRVKELHYILYQIEKESHVRDVKLTRKDSVKDHTRCVGALNAIKDLVKESITQDR